MPAVFVHGNPETDAIWRYLADALERDDVVCLSPPGFGAPVPDGFGGARLDYVAWLIGELEAIDGPIDLVGHDWGGGHVLGTAMARPDLVRTWASDVCGLFHPEYEWHDMAQLWMAPEVGEQTVAAMVDAPLADRTALFASIGMPDEIAAEVAAATDEAMGRCILSLYRTATRADLDAAAADLPRLAEVPGLAVVATDDAYLGDERYGREVAERAGAGVGVMADCGHWWMLQDPARAAEMLTGFWASA